MKPTKKSLKKLSFNSETISSLNNEELKAIKGGDGFVVVDPSTEFFGSRLTCFQTRSDRGCTSHTKCTRNSDGTGGGTILCID